MAPRMVNVADLRFPKPCTYTVFADFSANTTIAFFRELFNWAKVGDLSR